MYINDSIYGEINNQLRINNKNITSLYEKVSSGRRVNKAKDDPAALIAIQRMASALTSGMQEVANEYDKVAMNTVADSALGTVNDGLQVIRELQIQGQNAGSDAEKEALQDQIDKVTESIQSTIDNTKFNKKSLLSAGGNLQNILNGIGLNDVESIDNAIDEVSSMRADIGNEVQYAESSINSKLVELENQQESMSRIQDMDMARGLMNIAQEQIKQQTSIFSLKQLMTFNKMKITNLLS